VAGVGRHVVAVVIRRIPTRQRIAGRIGDLLDRHHWIPLAIVLVALYFINS